jgi:hypothetical protein
MAPGGSNVIEVLVQVVLYGLNIASLVFCLRCIVWDDKEWKLCSKINWPLITITLPVFLFSTVNFGISLHMTLLADNARDLPVYHALYAVATGLGDATFLIVDGVLIFRCWVVYSRAWRVIVLPLALLMVDTVLSVFVVALLAKIASDPSKNQALADLLSYSYMIFYASTAATNIYVTSAIVLRVARWNRDSHLGRLYDICCIISESGIPFTLMTVVGLVAKAIATTSSKFGLQSYMLDAINFSIASITLNLILIRAGEGTYSSEILESPCPKKCLMLRSPVMGFTCKDRSNQMSMEEGIHVRIDIEKY